jgi:hypothetical protein
VHFNQVFGTDAASNDGADEYFAYFALITSLAELGVGGREAAIHLLEYEIQSDRKALTKEEQDGETTLPSCSNPQAEDCRQARRNYLRRLIVLLRLETTQVQFLGMSAEPQNDFVNVHRSMEAIEHFDRALKYFDAKGLQRESLFGEQPNGRASCAPDLREHPNAQSVFGRFIYSEIVAENNVIDSVGKDPSMIDDHPELIPRLDRYAREVQTFDLDCVKELGVDVDARPVQLFESVGSYWTAKGTNFGATDSDLDHLHAIESNTNDTIKALCDAKAVYNLAKQALKPLPAQSSDARDIFNALNKIDSEYSKASDDDTLPRKIRDGRDKAARALSAYPAAEIDQVSPGCDK